MSINHFFQDLHKQTFLWHSHCSGQPHKLPPVHHHHQAWLNHHNGSSNLVEQVIDNICPDNEDYSRDWGVPAGLEKEPLFEKALTPSDVGKLNRLVIPKQHAEKYFPLSGESGDKGMLLNFEDESGKCWRFRYSYWSSSQSYVLTKGWSRYVKEKKLEAGDIILFDRHGIDVDRLFIGWRRRGEEASSPTDRTTAATVKRRSCGSYQTNPDHWAPPVKECTHPDQRKTGMTGSSKTLRLFGVDMECRLDESEPSTPDGSSLSSLGLGHQPMFSQKLHHQMDVTFINHQNIRNRRG